MRKHKPDLMVIVFVCVCAVLIGIIVWHFWVSAYPELKNVFSAQNDERIAAYIKSEGEFKGAVCIFALNIIQVISVFLPGGPVQIAAGLVYVWWKAFIICYIGFVCGNVLVYLVVKKRGQGRMVSGKKLQGITKKLKEKNPVMAVAMTNLLPGLPNGACPYLAVSTGVSLKDFVVAVGSTCWLQILMNCVAGHLFISGKYGWSVFAYVIEFVITGIIMWIYKRKRSMKKVP